MRSSHIHPRASWEGLTGSAGACVACREMDSPGNNAGHKKQRMCPADWEQSSRRGGDGAVVGGVCSENCERETWGGERGGDGLTVEGPDAGKWTLIRLAVEACRAGARQMCLATGQSTSGAGPGKAGKKISIKNGAVGVARRLAGREVGELLELGT